VVPEGAFESNFFGTTRPSMTEYLHMVYHRRQLLAADPVANTRLYPLAAPATAGETPAVAG
jgi:hypothetical protein